ncbi:MAG: hypothetical protein LBR53_02795 [Deltaproteobacteria bacterium]|jgi:hypothetical protein|nr:hypothetical protein [Deltaproteobacteria bacterium]
MRRICFSWFIAAFIAVLVFPPALSAQDAGGRLDASPAEAKPAPAQAPPHAAGQPADPAGPPPGPAVDRPAEETATLSTERLNRRRALLDDYFAKAEPILEDLRDQQLLYDSFKGNSNVAAQDVRAVVSEMRKLRDRLNALTDNLKADFEKNNLGKLRLPPVSAMIDRHLRRERGRDGGGRYDRDGSGDFDSPFAGKRFGSDRGWDRDRSRHRGWSGDDRSPRRDDYDRGARQDGYDRRVRQDGYDRRVRHDDDRFRGGRPGHGCDDPYNDEDYGDY